MLTDSSSQLATWEIILIITGVVLFIILVILVIFLVSIYKSITEQYFVINHLLALHSQGFIPVARGKLWCACAEEVIPPP